MKVLAILTAFAFTSGVMAADSSWLLCKGPADIEGKEINLVLNSLEHRAGISEEGEQLRINDLTLIYGNRLIIGKFNSQEADNANVLLVSNDSLSNFSGDIAFDYVSEKVALKGSLTLDVGFVVPVDTVLSCEQMN